MSLDVHIAPLGAERLVAVHASPVEALPLLAPFETVRLGPEEWLCLDATADALPASLRGTALVVDVGDSYEGWRVSGSGASALLARISALDPVALKPGESTRTLMGGIAVVLRMLPEGFELRVDRSFAQWFHRWLTPVARR